jgi:5-methylcytosine-specific restriction endonuclease McrA
VRNWKRENPNTNAAWIGLAGARKRAPNCVRKDFNFKATIPFYAEARRLTRETGVLHHVDHIKALADGGKHEATNLQVLTAKQNRTKATAEHRTNRRRSR